MFRGRLLLERPNKGPSRHTSHAQDVKGGDLQCLNRLAPDLGKQRVQQDARSPIPPTHGHLAPLCNPWPVAHVPVLTTKSTFVVLCHIHEELVQENQLARPKGPSVKKGHIGGGGTSGAVTGGAQDLEQRDHTRSCVRVFALGEGGRSELLPAAGDTSPGTERQKEFRALSHLASEVD